jgi:diguanylate cyclase
VTAAALAPNEAGRLRALAQLDVLDSAPEREFDALVRVAALVRGTPISLISLVDAERQWFKANVGLPGVTETPRELAFCAHAILQDGVFEVPDATADPRFTGNALVTGEPDIRFYAGATLKLSDGTHAGTLCVIDRQPGRLNTAQREALAHLAAAAVLALEGRQALRAQHELKEAAERAGAALAASEERYRQLYAATPAMLHAIDPQGRLTSVSQRWLQTLGYTRDEVLGRLSVDFLTDASRAHAKSVLPRLFAEGRYDDLSLQMVCKDGQIIDVLLSAVLERDDAGQPARGLAVVRDVTAALRIERALQAEHERLASIIDGTGAGTWEWNVQTGEARFNERWAAIIGYTLQELGPTSIQTWMQHAHPDDLQRSAELLDRHFAGELSHYDCEARMRHRDGHWLWVLDRGRVLTWTPDGKPEWMFGTHLDLTEHKRHEDQLRKSEQLLNRTGEVAGVGGWELDLSTGTLWWSAQTCRIHGLEPGHSPVLDEAINFYAPEVRPVVQAAVETAMTTGQGWDLELPFIPADGRRIWVRAVGGAEFVDGKPVRLVGAFQDITARRAAAAELAEQHELLRVTLQSIGDAVITTDASGHVTWLNPVAERMTGWLNADAQGRPVGQVFHIVNEETRKPTEHPVATCLAQGKVTGLANHTVLISRDGEEFGIEDSAAPIRSGSGKHLGCGAGFPRRDRAAASERRDELPRLTRRTDGPCQPRRVRDPAAPRIEQVP